MPDALVKIRLEGDEAVAGADRLTAALGRMERSEPTRALRSTRTAVDELAASAAGLSPALSRVIANFAQMGIGGVTGLAAVGGIAAIGLEIKKIIDIVPELETKFRKMNEEFAKMGGPGSVGRAHIADIQDRLSTLSKGDWWTKGLSALRAIGGGTPGEGALGVYEGIEQIQQRTEEGTLKNELQRMHAEALKYHADAMSQRTVAPTALQGIETRAKEMRGFAEAAELTAAKLALARQGITDASDPIYVDRLERIKGKFQGITTGLSDLSAAAKKAASDAEILKATLERTAEGVLSGGVLFGDVVHAKVNQRTGVRTGPSFGSRNMATGPLAAQRGNAGAISISGAIEAQTAGDVFTGQSLMSMTSQTANRPGESPMAEAARKRERSDTAREIGAVVGATFALIASGHGGAAAALAGAGGLASSIGGLSALSKTAASGFGIAGVALSGIGMLASLFSSGPPTVMIDGYSSRALSQQQQLLLALTGYKGVNVQVLSAGGDTARIAYQLGRDARTDSQSRIPPGWSG